MNLDLDEVSAWFLQEYNENHIDRRTFLRVLALYREGYKRYLDKRHLLGLARKWLVDNYMKDRIDADTFLFGQSNEDSAWLIQEFRTGRIDKKMLKRMLMGGNVPNVHSLIDP